MQALKIGHLGGIACFHQRLVTRLDEGREPAAQDDLLAEKIGLRLLAKIRFDDAGPAASDRRRIRKPNLFGVARRILMDGEQTRHAGAFKIF